MIMSISHEYAYIVAAIGQKAQRTTRLPSVYLLRDSLGQNSLEWPSDDVVCLVFYTGNYPW